MIVSVCKCSVALELLDISLKFMFIVSVNATFKLAFQSWNNLIYSSVNMYSSYISFHCNDYSSVRVVSVCLSVIKFICLCSSKSHTGIFGKFTYVTLYLRVHFLVSQSVASHLNKHCIHIQTSIVITIFSCDPLDWHL